MLAQHRGLGHPCDGGYNAEANKQRPDITVGWCGPGAGDFGVVHPGFGAPHTESRRDVSLAPRVQSTEIWSI